MKKEIVRYCFYVFLGCISVGIESEMLLFGMNSDFRESEKKIKRLPQCVEACIKDSNVGNFLCSKSSGMRVYKNGLFRGYNPDDLESVKMRCSQSFDEKTMPNKKLQMKFLMK
ncbi:MAG: hypothetical protein LBT90_01335 [Holosporaceae bacterium]|jgi:hypothetical protein|nr:hypothetical protein [Holosporaceae bacterium]